MTLPRISLLPRILIAMVLGIAAGFVLPAWGARVFATFNSFFSAFLNFLIPLLIIGFVAPAIAELGRRAGRMLAATAAIAYAMTVAVGLLAYATADLTFPALISPQSIEAAALGHASPTPQPYFTIGIEPLMGVTTALVLAFLLGLGSAGLASDALRRGLADFRDVIRCAISGVIIPGLPVYIFGIFLDMTIAGQVTTVLVTFSKIILVIFALHIGVLLLQFALASLFSGVNPLRALAAMMPAYFTALGTQSSAATIPVTLRRTTAIGVNADVAGFVIPLCATIHMSGSTLKIVACAMALMILHGMPYDLPMFAGFIAMLAITIVAAPGVPGGAIMASLGLLTSMLGFDDNTCALMIALYIAMDSFGTACNITGDAAIAQIVARIFRKTPAAEAQTTA